MVKLGFIVEGATEKIILEQSDFFRYLESQNIQFVPEIIDAEGNGNLLPRNIEPLTKRLEDQGATKIIVLTDLDDDACITSTKERISPLSNHTVVVSKKKIESWFLADIEGMKSFFNDQSFSYAHPEITEDPYEEIRQLRINKLGRGIASKLVLANHMTQQHGFSIMRSAEHPNCTAAKYFLNKVTALGQTNK